MKQEFVDKFKWPLSQIMHTPYRGLHKPDRLMENIEELVRQIKASSPITGGTRRTEKTSKVKEWIETQHNHEKQVKTKLNVQIIMDFKIEDFPKSATGEDTLTITTSKSQLYMIDSTIDFINCYKHSFPQREIGWDVLLDSEKGTFLFEIDSIESGGRAFSGDPFTGQIAAYSKIFATDLNNESTHNYIIYYPHQLYSQFYNRNGKIKDNKGIKTIKNLVDCIITNEGVIVCPHNWEVYY